MSRFFGRAGFEALITPALVVLALTGCAAFGSRLEAPHLSIVGVELMKSDFWEQRLRVRLRVQNPNDRVLPVKGLTVALELQGEDFARGVSAERFEVPAFGEAEFDMNVTANAASALLRLLGRGEEFSGETVAYRLTGKVSLASGVLRSIPFEEEGRIRLR